MTSPSPPSPLPTARPDPQKGTGSRADLACVVLGLGNPPELPAAVRSLLGQGVPVEVVVVNSGGGGAPGSLSAAGLDVTVIEVIEIVQRLLPGAARNRGIAATQAPFIAFLAADCLAEPGWAEARLRAHRAGVPAVASAVTNPFRYSLAAWASYVVLFSRRMPGAPPADALRYGVSYERTLFDRFGLFREELRGGEDTEFHQRMTAGEVPIAWEPAVRTAHRHPRRVTAFLADQYRRGARMAGSWGRLQGPRPGQVAADALRRLPADIERAWRSADRKDRPWIAAASLLLPVAALAYAAGALARRSSTEVPS